MTGRPTKPLEAYPPADLPPLPPEGAAGEPVAAEVAPPRPQAEVAVLDFVDPAAMRSRVALRHPFRLDGRVVDSVEVRKLSAGEVGRIVGDRGQDDRIELYEFYAVMTGLPASVLRGLPDDDNGAVVDAARPFLPRLAQALFFGPTSEPGDATPSSPSGA